ncbi:hypothetical protein P171DRAFT_405649 [Karstenula rhodostoma CBS 690.94]|uniref:ABM domain-containing protein n=1 Tax=Karstenula rhodostoma CBS 690.94 TaxID=1392251 RepID=A0A9P4UI68_9PLEO|nr:hypothetical protein P171DRAFT_405649 [Karstenula rhodostoma CBS 690.94]
MSYDSETSPQFPPIPDDEFCVYGTVYAHAKRADDLEKIYAETTRLAQFEKGVVYYCLGRDSKDPSVFYFFERYRGKEAFEGHNRQSVVQKLLKDKIFKRVTASFVKPILAGVEGGTDGVWGALEGKPH